MLNWQPVGHGFKTHQGRAYFNVQLITICAVVKSKCAVEKVICAAVKCAVVDLSIGIKLIVIKNIFVDRLSF